MRYYDREYFQMFCPAGHVTLRVKATEKDKDPFSILMRMLDMDWGVTGTIDDLAEDAIWIAKEGPYAPQEAVSAAFPGSIVLPTGVLRERVPYENIMSVEPHPVPLISRHASCVRPGKP